MINKDELLQIVDENNKPVSQKPRQEVHSKGLWHRVSHVWIVNSKNEILCQKRSLLKDSNPGKWEPFFGGHLGPNVTYIDGAKIEVEEELGLKLDSVNLDLWKTYKNERGKEFQGVFVYKWDDDANNLTFEAEEIDQIKWIPFDEVKNSVLSKEDNNWSKIGYEEELFKYLAR